MRIKIKFNKIKRFYITLTLLTVLMCYSFPTINMNNEQHQNFTNLEHLFPIASGPDEFISVWDTTKTSFGSSNSSQVRLPLLSSGIYNFTVDWGDLTNDTITIWNQDEVTHNYESEGLYTLRITGIIIGWRFALYGDLLKIAEIQQWGSLQLGNLGEYFSGCYNLELTAIDNLNLTGTTKLFQAFHVCENLGASGSMNGWDTSSVTDMRAMFYGTSSFNQPIEGWNTSSVTDMSHMFAGASSFNQPLENWDISNVVSMESMFYNASSFNQPIEGWNTSSVTIMRDMFSYATKFNQPLNSWNTSQVIHMSSMFAYTSLFNQPLNNWDVSNVREMGGMFSGAISFNQPLGNWKTSTVDNMHSMFSDASSFNQPIGSWDTSNVRFMERLFSDATAFNQNIGNWDTSSVFFMNDMFAYATSFSQDLSNWDVSNVISMSGMFYGVTLSTSNYNSLLIQWSQLALQSDLTFHAGYSRYSSGTAENARNYIINTFSWTIYDGGVYSPDTLTLIKPDESSSWEKGTRHEITWTSTGMISDVNIELYNNGQFVMEIRHHTSNDGEYSWYITTELNASDSYQVKIIDTDYILTYVFSDLFQIRNQSTSTTAPNVIFGYDIPYLIGFCLFTIVTLIVLYKKRLIFKQ